MTALQVILVAVVAFVFGALVGIRLMAWAAAHGFAQMVQGKPDEEKRELLDRFAGKSNT